ncbi:MAG: GIY-YIG nuclease family protein [Clostridia bacterium]|nr:GIY-YIG nuclease family protein [Clostridia bacterium]
MSKKYIYIMTNESFHASNWIKIGCTDNVEKRQKQLSNTSVPLPFKIYATYELPQMEDNKKPDKAIHDLIQTIAPNRKISNNREFFELEPWEAYDILTNIAQLHNRLDKLKRYDDNNYGAEIIGYTVDERNETDLFKKTEDLHILYSKLKNIIKEIDPNLMIKPNKFYIAYKKVSKNVFAVWPQSNRLEVILYAKLGQINDATGTIYDISNRLWTSSQYAFKYDFDTDEDTVKELLNQTYSLFSNNS